MVNTLDKNFLDGDLACHDASASQNYKPFRLLRLLHTTEDQVCFTRVAGTCQLAVFTTNNEPVETLVARVPSVSSRGAAQRTCTDCLRCSR